MMIRCFSAADFLGLPDVTTCAAIKNSIVNYCKTNGLLDADGETLNLNTELMALLGIDRREWVTITNLHRFLRELNHTPNHRDSGFQEKVLLSDKLATFLDVAPGTKLSRSDIIKPIIAYCRSSGLMAGHQINPDAALIALLDLNPHDYISILNFQRYLRPFYTAE